MPVRLLLLVLQGGRVCRHLLLVVVVRVRLPQLA